MIHKQILFFATILLISTKAFAVGQLSPFQTNGCSFFPEGTIEQKNLWHCCCVVHDFEYWAGGSAQDRAAADQRLFQCIQNKSEFAAMAAYVGVRSNPRRWGNAWRLEQPSWYRQIKMNNWQTKTSDDWMRLGAVYLESFQNLSLEDQQCLSETSGSVSFDNK
jgi:hypothetical protein